MPLPSALMRALSRDETWLLLRFGVVGLLNAAFGYLAFVLLLWTGVWPGAALAIAAMAGTAFNFQTSRRLVFRSRGHVVKFVAVYLIVLAVNWVALRVLRSQGLSDALAQAVLTLPIAALSFVGQSRFVFPRPGEGA